MRLAVKADYACRAISVLAQHYPNTRPLRIEEIARREGIPANYLVQILIELKGKGLIKSQRGKEGGYVLAKLPREIRIGDVLRAVNGELVELPALTGSGAAREIQKVWRRIKLAAEEAADAVTFEEICAQAAGRAGVYYI